MATKRKSAASGLEFPGQHVYVRSTNEDAEAPEHQARVQNWIQEYEKNRQVFVFPTPTVRTFSTLLLVLGLLSLLIQVKTILSSSFGIIKCNFLTDRLVVIALCVCAKSPRLWYLDRHVLRGYGRCWLGFF